MPSTAAPSSASGRSPCPCCAKSCRLPSNSTAAMDLVLFDLDNTLLSGDSDFEWAQFLIGKGVLDAELHEARNLEFYEQYRAGTLDIHAFLDLQLLPLSRHSRHELDAWHAEFMAERIRPLIGAPARALVDRHLASGALAAIVTATDRKSTRLNSSHMSISYAVF